MKIKIQLVNELAVTPTYGTSGAACFDFYAPITGGTCNISLDNPITVMTGVKVEIPKGYVMLIFSRSGHGFKQGVRLANCVGVIDSDYRGEIGVKLTADELGSSLTIKNGDRIAQGFIMPIQQVEFEVVSELSETVRGENGFGSTDNELPSTGN